MVPYVQSVHKKCNPNFKVIGVSIAWKKVLLSLNGSTYSLNNKFSFIRFRNLKFLVNLLSGSTLVLLNLKKIWILVY